MTIAVEQVSHAFDALQVLQDISFTVGTGEIVAVIGPSGCGKSTLLSIIGGILRPSAGRVCVDRPFEGSLNPLTFVFQDFALLPWRTAADNVSFVLEHRRLDLAERRRRVADALARTGLTDFADAFPKQLSGGMRQRVGLARALAVRPSVLLMDEPLSALDSQTREIMMDDLIALLGGVRMSVLYVTHNLEEAVRLGDRVLVLSRRPGRIREIVKVAIPRAERTGDAAVAELARMQRRLWALIRSEAADAEREVASV